MQFALLPSIQDQGFLFFLFYICMVTVAKFYHRPKDCDFLRGCQDYDSNFIISA